MSAPLRTPVIDTRIVLEELAGALTWQRLGKLLEWLPSAPPAERDTLAAEAQRIVAHLRLDPAAASVTPPRDHTDVLAGLSDYDVCRSRSALVQIAHEARHWYNTARNHEESIDRAHALLSAAGVPAVERAPDAGPYHGDAIVSVWSLGARVEWACARLVGVTTHA